MIPFFNLYVRSLRYNRETSTFIGETTLCHMEPETTAVDSIAYTVTACTSFRHRYSHISPPYFKVLDATMNEIHIVRAIKV